MLLKDLKPRKRKSIKRIGRGIGSGHGTYSCRGMKGQGSRAGGLKGPGFEGGQMPFIQKIPKLKGFKHHSKVNYQILNVVDLNVFDDGSDVNNQTLHAKKLISNLNVPVKILSDGNLERKDLKIAVEKMSQKAKEKIEQSGSKIIEITK